MSLNFLTNYAQLSTWAEKKDEISGEEVHVTFASLSYLKINSEQKYWKEMQEK